MKRCTTFLILSLFVHSIYSQQISYEFDTSSMYFVNALTSDTLLKIGNIVNSQVNQRIQQNQNSGYITFRASDNPAIKLHDQNAHNNVEIFSKLNDSGGGILLSDHENNRPDVIRLVTNYANTGDARVITDELQINGGSDLAELFYLSTPKEKIEPGLLVSLDPNHPGELMISSERYDQKIAGVLSGANGVKPGILMGQTETIAYGDELVTLSGRTYLMANTTNGAIAVGDLITTSKMPGEGMRATNRRRSKGAVIGKAMTPLEEGSGYILVLVNLQ